MAGPVYAQFAMRSKNARAMIRDGDWKYSHYAADTPELYHLRDDPREMNNLAGVARHREKEAELRERLLGWNNPAAGV
jgi:choline-sulfatase